MGLIVAIAAAVIVIGLVIFLVVHGKHRRKNEDMIYPFW